MLAEKFFKLFAGNERAHGMFLPDDANGGVKKNGVYTVIKTPPNVDLWQKHLDGEKGIRIIPITQPLGAPSTLIITALTTKP